VPPGDDGDGPRDTSSPPGVGDKPRDGQTPGGGGDGPRDVPSDPCEKIKDLRTQATRLWHEINNPRTTAARRSEVRKKFDEVSKRIRELEDDCPNPDGQEPRDTGKPRTEKPPSVPTVTIYVKAKSSVLKGDKDTSKAVAKLQVKLVVSAVADPQLPGNGVDKPQTDHAQAPIQGTTDNKGNLTLKAPTATSGTGAASGTGTPSSRPLNKIGGPAFRVTLDATPKSSSNVKTSGSDPQAAVAGIPESAKKFLTDVNVINGSVFLTFTYPLTRQKSMNRVLIQIPGVVNIEINFCRDKQDALDDPYFKGTGAWGQAYDDQWAIKRVGLTAEQYVAWNRPGSKFSPVIVAVIDTGLDWNHLDFNWTNLWQNPNEIAGNGIDDDGNGYVDDMIGWDFMSKHNKPWDHDGHGTHVTGVIAADRNNGIGMAGINPHVRVMVLKAVNNFGHTRASYLAKAIVYAVDNGAQVINMSVGGKNLSTMEHEAVKYATSKGVLIVAAAGNEGINVGEFGPAGVEGVLTVASTDLQDKRAGFSNWGPQIDLAAPGIDVLGLRARRTDTMRDIPGVEYVSGANFVGDDNRYYRASGTSFSAPIVTGVASLILSRRPDLSGQQVARMLKQSATDTDVPGVDQYSGYGIVNAVGAMKASPQFFIHSAISGFKVVNGEGGLALQVLGTADADRFRKATVSIGAGDNPASWTDVLDIKQNVRQGLLGNIPASHFAGAKTWTIRLTTEHQSGTKREIRFLLNLG
jgi:subtilisin family serine protease